MGVMDVRRRLIAAQPHLVTASGASVTAVIAEPQIRKLAVTFSPMQLGSGTPSTTNVRPIYGYATISASIGPRPYDISLGGTYYGGTVDLVSGTMTVTHVLETRTWGNLTTRATWTNCQMRTDTKSVTSASNECVCNVAPYIYQFELDTPHAYVNNGNWALMCALPIGTPDSTVIQWAFALQTPQTVSLTPQTIAALRGQRMVMSPSGNVEITYWTH